MVDIEADGPIPGDYSMVCFGAIVVEPGLTRSFYGQLKPISEKWLRINVRHVGDGGRRCFTMYLATVASLTSMPSLSSSP